jgi:hypothetical protein
MNLKTKSIEYYWISLRYFLSRLIFDWIITKINYYDLNFIEIKLFINSMYNDLIFNNDKILDFLNNKLWKVY